MALSREAAEAVIRSGGGFMLNGEIYTRIRDLPENESLYGEDTSKELEAEKAAVPKAVTPFAPVESEPIKPKTAHRTAKKAAEEPAEEVSIEKPEEVVKTEK